MIHHTRLLLFSLCALLLAFANPAQCIESPDSEPELATDAGATAAEAAEAAAEETAIKVAKAAPAGSTVALDAMPQGAAVRTAWVKAGYQFTPEVRAAYLASVKAEVETKLKAANEIIPADFMAWIDADPMVASTIYGNLHSPVTALRTLRALDIDLGADVVRKEYTQIALAFAAYNAVAGQKVDLTPRQPMKLVIPPNPCQRVDTKDPKRTLDVNDHIINFLNDHPLEYEVKIPPAIKGDPVKVEKHSRPLRGADVLLNKDLQAKFNAYMKEKGQTARVNCGGPSPANQGGTGNAPFVNGYKLFRAAYEAKGLLPPKRDANPTYAETCAFLIRNDRFRFPEESKRFWPSYPLKSPWPTLTFLPSRRDPLRECENLWQNFVATGRPCGAPAYLGWVAQKPLLLEGRSVAPLDFGYGSVQMMLKDGGVCGTQSGVIVRSRLALGQPASTYATKGHCGYTICYYDAATNTHRIGGSAHVTLGIRNNAPWIFQGPGMRAMVYHHSVFWASNYGLQSFLDSMVVYGMFSRLSPTDRKDHGMALVGSGLDLNPYNILLTDAASQGDPVDLLRIMRQVVAKQTEASKAKPGCPVNAFYMDGHLLAALSTAPISKDPQVVRELYAYLQEKDKAAPPMAMARYRTAVDRLPATLSKAESVLKDHLASARNAQTCQTTGEILSAAAAQITDPVERQAWAKKCLRTMSGHESYFFGKNWTIYPDSTVSVLAKLAGEKVLTPGQMMQSFTDAITNRLKADVADAGNAAVCPQLLAEIRVTMPQIKDAQQKNQWRQDLFAAVGDRAPYATFKRCLTKIDWHVTAVSRQSVRYKAWGYCAVDGSPDTVWSTAVTVKDPGTLPQEVTVDMGAVKALKGFTVMPRGMEIAGRVDACAFYTSLDGKQWTLAAEKKLPAPGEPVAEFKGEEWQVPFAKTQARYFKFVATHTAQGTYANVAEIGVIEAED